MRFEKKKLAGMERCYSVAVMDIEGEPHAFYATEGKGGCIAFDCETFTSKKDILDEPGGTMSIVKIPNRDDEFLIGEKFFKLFEWEEAGMAWVKRMPDGTYIAKSVLSVPYLHRFDILQSEVDGVKKSYFIGCSLAAHKDTREDWSRAGAVHVCELPESWDEPFELTVLHDDFYQNHGYERINWNGHEAGMITCQSGVYVFTPPQNGTDWRIEKIMSQPTSDAAVIDIDGDGELEIATIEDFHGSYYRVYKKINGNYEMIFEHPEVTEFYHVAGSGIINGTPVFIGGCRRGKQQLFLLSWNNENSEIEVHTVDEGVGPSNAMIYNGVNGDYIISANREIAECAVYKSVE